MRGGVAAGVVVWVLAFLAGCPAMVRPDPGVAAEGEGCSDTLPCDEGLRCQERVCVVDGGGGSSSSGGGSSSSGSSGGVDAGPPECGVRLDCALNGSVDGRNCVDGRCVYIPCTENAECGRRACVDGFCADADRCSDDTQCAPSGLICEGGICVAGCGSDAECNAGALPVNTCSEGRCRQRCLGDITCTLTGGICVNNVCVPPECTTDMDCGEPGLLRCDTSRCVETTPCSTAADCPDNNACTSGHCEPLPPCLRDPDCGPGNVCEAGYCRPAPPCSAGGSCAAGTECVGGQCVPAPECRGNGECAAPLICRAGSCQPPSQAAVARVLIATPAGLCDPLLDMRAACALTVRPGDALPLSVITLDAAGRVVAGVSADWLSDLTAVADVTPGPATESVLTAGLDVGEARITASARGVTSPAVRVRNLAAAAAVARVVVTDGGDGTPVAGAVVRLNALEVTTGADGIALFDDAGLAAPYALHVFHAAHEYVSVLDLAAPAAGTLELTIPLAPAVPGPVAGGLRGTVNLDQAPSQGPVSFSLSGVSAPSVPGLSFSRLIGDTFMVDVTLPVIGAQTLPMPGGVTLTAEVPVLGTQHIKDSFHALGTGGRRMAWAFGGRMPFQAFQGLLGQQGAIGTLFALAPYFEGLTHGIQTGYLLTDLPYVRDGDTEFDGEPDVDNDGDEEERVPDYFAFPQAPLTVRQEQTLRVDVRVASVPSNAAGGQALLAAGARLPGHGFVPLGLAAARPAQSGPLQRTMKLAPRYGGLETGDYALAAFAFSQSGGMTMRMATADVLPASVDLGTMLPLATGSSFNPGTRALSVAGLNAADVHRATLEGPTGRWRVWLAGGGTTHAVVLPAVPTGMPDRGLTGVAAEAFQLAPALHAATAADQTSVLASGSTQGLSRVAQETVGLSRGGLGAP